MLLASNYLPGRFKYSTTIQAGGYALVLMGCSIYAPMLLNNRLWQFLGKISYSLYLVHPPAIFTLNPLYQRVNAMESVPVTFRFALSRAINLVAVTALSYATCRLVEQPRMRIRKAWLLPLPPLRSRLETDPP